MLRLHGQIGAELIRRGISRTGNNPCADFAETLYCRTFAWIPEPNSKAGYDAIATGGRRVQIKSRRLTPRNASRQSGTMRKLAEKPFDALAGIVFNQDYAVLLAFEMDHATVLQLARFSDHVKGSCLNMRDALLAIPGVIDHTATLGIAAQQLLLGHA